MSTTQVFPIKWFVKSDVTFTQEAMNLYFSQLIADANLILAKTTSAQFVNDGFVFNQDVQPWVVQNSLSQLLAGPCTINIWVTPSPTLSGLSGIDMPIFDLNGNAGMKMKLVTTRDKRKLRANTNEMRDYVNLLRFILASLVHICGLRGIFVATRVTDATNEMPLGDFDIRRYPNDLYWNEEVPYKSQYVLDPSVGYDTSLPIAKILSSVRFADMTSTIISNAYKNPSLVPKPSLTDIKLKILDDRGQGIPNVRAKIITDPMSATVTSEVLTDSNGDAYWSWTGVPFLLSRDNMRLIKVYADGYEARVLPITVIDLFEVVLSDGPNSKFEIIIYMHKQLALPQPQPQESGVVYNRVKWFIPPGFEKQVRGDMDLLKERLQDYVYGMNRILAHNTRRRLFMDPETDIIINDEGDPFSWSPTLPDGSEIHPRALPAKTFKERFEDLDIWIWIKSASPYAAIVDYGRGSSIGPRGVQLNGMALAEYGSHVYMFNLVVLAHELGHVYGTWDLYNYLNVPDKSHTRPITHMNYRDYPDDVYWNESMRDIITDPMLTMYPADMIERLFGLANRPTLEELWGVIRYSDSCSAKQIDQFTGFFGAQPDLTNIRVYVIDDATKMPIENAELYVSSHVVFNRIPRGLFGEIDGHTNAEGYMQFNIRSLGVGSMFNVALLFKTFALGYVCTVKWVTGIDSIRYAFEHGIKTQWDIVIELHKPIVTIEAIQGEQRDDSTLNIDLRINSSVEITLSSIDRIDAETRRKFSTINIRTRFIGERIIPVKLDTRLAKGRFYYRFCWSTGLHVTPSEKFKGCIDSNEITVL